MSKVWVDLTHPFSAEIPRWPYFDKPEITSKHSMAKGGVTKILFKAFRYP